MINHFNKNFRNHILQLECIQNVYHKINYRSMAVNTCKKFYFLHSIYIFASNSDFGIVKFQLIYIHFIISKNK